jgi:hypothetical protein
MLAARRAASASGQASVEFVHAPAHGVPPVPVADHLAQPVGLAPDRERVLEHGLARALRTGPVTSAYAPSKTAPDDGPAGGFYDDNGVIAW